MSEKRKVFSITFDKGLDKTTLPFESSPARALDEMNYVYRDGKVQKRFGATELLEAPATKYVVMGFNGVGDSSTGKVNTGNFNGLWRFLAEDGNQHFIAHIGKLIYEIARDENGDYEAEAITAQSGLAQPTPGDYHIWCYEFLDYKSVAVVGNKCLYFFGGNQLMKLRYEANGTRVFKPVENGTDTYVPTTTIGITYRNSYASGRQSYDEVNLMSQWRKNLLLSGTGVDGSGAILETDVGYVYQLDSPIIGKSAGDVDGIRIKIKRRGA